MNKCKDCIHCKIGILEFLSAGYEYAKCNHPSLMTISPVTGCKKHKENEIQYCYNRRHDDTDCAIYSPK